MARRPRSASRQPGPSRKRARLAMPAREPSIVEIIELTDSDNDAPVYRTSKKGRRKPGPSQTTPNGSVTFGKPNAEILADAPASAPGPFQNGARPALQGNSGPLFLPGSDDEQHAAHTPLVSAAKAVPDAALAHPRPVPPAPAPVDLADGYVARVLEIVPDVQPAHALALIEQLMVSQPNNVVEFVLHALFDNPSYPKVDRKGKHRREEPHTDTNTRASPRPRVDYASKDRVCNHGPHYFERSLEQLMMDFPRIPKPHIRSRLLDNRFYAPTHLLLAEELKKEPLPFRLKTTNSVIGKGKARQDPEFDLEREWLFVKVAELAAERDAALAAAVNEQENQDSEEGIECGCCFSDYPFDQMIQCPEAHLFCRSCMTSYASNLLGEHNPNIVCMDQSGCKLPFPESELGRFLSSKLLELYYRVKQRKDIEAAGLENLEECPFCEYKCVIENQMEKLFRCENAECSAITCRACKKSDHLPKTCKEADEDKHLDAQHVIEEAMTQALMRNCPKCQKSFIKEMGCNKMTCPSCRTVSCYICRKIIEGYDHFSNPPPYSGKVDKSKCNLWDPVEQRHTEEVTLAAKRALAELRKTRPDVDETTLKVDLPGPQAPGSGSGPGRPAPLPPLPPPHQAVPPPMFQLPMLHGGGRGRVPPPIPAFAGGVDNRAGPLGVGAGMGAGAGVGVGVGVGAGAGVGVGAGAAGGNPFMFGGGQAHQFMPDLVALRAAPYPYVPNVPIPAQAAVVARGGKGKARGRRRKLIQ